MKNGSTGHMEVKMPVAVAGLSREPFVLGNHQVNMHKKWGGA
jgi:hypothetical protein